MRSFYLNSHSGTANSKFNARFPPASPRPVSLTDEAYLSDALENITIPQYIHAFQSMRRDFPGVPIMIANQAYMFSLDQPVDPSMDVVMPVPLYFKMYERLRRGAENALRGYGEGEWMFFDMHEYYQKNLASKFKPGDGVHLTDDKTETIAALIAERAFPTLCKRARQARAAQNKPAPRFFAKVTPPAWPEKVLDLSGASPRLVIDGKTYSISVATAGSVKWPNRVAGGTLFTGWAIDGAVTKEAAEVVLIANGRLVGRAKPDRPRRDIGSMNRGFRNSGWAITVPADGRLHGRIGVFALMHDGRGAHELGYSDPFPFSRGLLRTSKPKV